MRRKTAARIVYSSNLSATVFFLCSSLLIIPDAFAATSFGTDYRQLTESNPSAGTSIVTSGQYGEELAVNSIIKILAAYHLDSDRKLLSDIYEDSRELDGIWSEKISDGHYVRVSFETDLTSSNDITVYPRVLSGNPIIEIYEKGGTELVAELLVKPDQYNKVFLTNLQGNQDTFDLRILDGSVELDHVIDPTAPQYQSHVTVSTGTGNLVFNKPSGTAQGDLLIVFMGFEKGSDVAITPPSGWTLVQRINSGTDNGAAAYYKMAGSSEPASYTFTLTNSPKHAGGIVRYSGVDSVNPINVSATNSGTSSTSQVAPSVTTTVNNAKVLVYYTSKKPATYTPAATTTERWDAPNTADGLPSNMMADFEQVTAGATGTKTATASEAEVWQTITVALTPADSGVYTRSVSEPMAITDTVSTMTHFVRQSPENSGAMINDGTSRMVILTRESTEATDADITDNVSRMSVLGRESAATITVSDIATRIRTVPRTVSETTGSVVTDSLARSIILSRSVSESLDAIVSDAVSRIAAFARESSETSIVSDIASRMLASSRSISDDSIAISDGISRAAIMARESIEDSGAVISDEVSRAAVLARQSTEASGLVISDGVSRLAAIFRQPADSTIVSDATNRVLAFSRKVADDGSVISETVSKMTYFVRESAEDSGALVTDSVSRATVMTRELAEVSEAVINDGAARMAIMIRESTETSGSLISDFISSILDAFEPEVKDRPRDNNGGAGGGGGGRSIIVQDETFFETNPLQKIVLPSVSILDSKGSQFSQVQTGEVVQISTVIENRQKDAQEYVVIVQIVDENNMAQAILLSPGVIESGQRSTATLDWTPDAAGRYSLAIFVCDKLDVSHSTFLLSQKVNKNVVVS